MRRQSMKRLVWLLSAVLLVSIGLVASAQEPASKAPPKAASPQALPLNDVVMYSGGVGYFQRDGSIEGRGDVELRFKVDNINDLLKSMIVQDFYGGRVTTVTYDSRDPITKTLNSFAVDLTTHPGLGQLLEQIRGERIEVAAPNRVVGVVVGVEKKREKVSDKEVGEVEYLNILTGDGLRSIPLNQVQRIKIANEQLDAELRQALEVLESSHDLQKKAVRLAFDGNGRRRVRVGYIVETPVWKTSYRVALSETKQPFLQGWAIVENTTDEDWANVRLSLIPGGPIWLGRDLWEPLYAKRPLVVSELYESLRPQVYGQAMAEPGETPQEASAAERGPGMASLMAKRAMAPKPSPAPPQRPAEVELQEGIASIAQATEAGGGFQYTIHRPASLARQKKALLPIFT